MKANVGDTFDLKFVVERSMYGRPQGKWSVRVPNNTWIELDFGSDDNPNTSQIVTAANMVMTTWLMAQPKTQEGAPYR